MKRTGYAVAVEQHSTYIEYRMVFTDGTHYYIKRNGKLINVDEDIKSGHYLESWQVK